MIELGSGRFGADQWRLMYDPEGFPPGDDHLASGPIVSLYVGSSGGGRPVELDPLTGSLGRSILVVRDPTVTAYAFGKVAFGFDRVQLDCAKGQTVDAIVVDCADHLPFNHYVGEIASRVVLVSATGPDGRTAEREQGQ
jgi:hypothetical protein